MGEQLDAVAAILGQRLDPGGSPQVLVRADRSDDLGVGDVADQGMLERVLHLGADGR